MPILVMERPTFVCQLFVVKLYGDSRCIARVKRQIKLFPVLTSLEIWNDPIK